ncbi:AMP-binding protein [Pseudonocardia halophobica]|uniref:AMP-dependent synthetase n=1 Tax=Pseudonocardia halophobica TaxID=29401 RepID=A0A9W6NZG6_9PSEU|nr:AMP-dependent synthetase [Pseudonocardia halophobica]
MTETPGFAGALARHGGRPALLVPGGECLSYRELAARADARAAELGTGRRLVAVVAGPGVEPVVTYLAALRAGHVALLVGDDPARAEPLLAAHDPAVVVRPEADGVRIEERGPGPALHPDLALLLPTSGTTGSPKLVRLSARNLAANAESIAGYLPIRPGDRAPLTLPLQYCYGLSVVNSNLARGATVVLSSRSVAEPAFWTEFAELGLTSLHGVPYTFDLLDATGFADRALPSLRYVTQAGGRWDPAAVERYAALGAGRGWALYVMYGQTEATARMAYLPPERAATAPSAVGVAVPGGTFSIERPDPDGVGDLVYRGENVMLGYARSGADLALGRTVDRLETGDRARLRPDGLLEITGRAARFVKPFGLRVDLDEVERILAAGGVAAAATGDDTGLAVAVVRGGDATAVADLLAERLRLPPTAVRVAGVDALPRLPTGKVDLAAVAAAAAPQQPPAGADPVRRAFAAVFPGRTITDGDTFVGLGGDSLRYVQTALRLQRTVGALPPDWPERTVAELVALGGPGRAPRRWLLVETPVVLRAAAIVLIVGSHVGLFRLLGGSHVLLAAAGWAFARFALAPPRPSRTILRTAARIAVPSALWVAWRATVADDVDWYNALLLNYVVDPEAWGYWFVETLPQILLLMALLFVVPAVRALDRSLPFALPAAVYLAGLLGQFVDDGANAFSLRQMSVHTVIWLFALGWAAQRAATAWQRAAVLAGLAVAVPMMFAHEPHRAAVVAVGTALLLVPALAVPRPLVRLCGLLAGASLAIYLTHYAVMSALAGLPSAVVVLACLVVGVAVQEVLGRAAASVRVEAHRSADLQAHLAARLRGLRFGRAAAQRGAAELHEHGRVVPVEDHLPDARRPAGA